MTRKTEEMVEISITLPSRFVARLVALVERAVLDGDAEELRVLVVPEEKRAEEHLPGPSLVEIQAASA
jgi:hypothetical protein